MKKEINKINNIYLKLKDKLKKFNSIYVNDNNILILEFLGSQNLPVYIAFDEKGQWIYTNKNQKDFIYCTSNIIKGNQSLKDFFNRHQELC